MNLSPVERGCATNPESVLSSPAPVGPGAQCSGPHAGDSVGGAETGVGWIKIHRQLARSICWTYSLEMRSMWITMLLMANHAPAWWRGEKIEAGQFMASLSHLAAEARITFSQVRTCLRLLSRWNQLRAENLAWKMTRITICNWGAYQGSSQGKSQADRKPIASRSQTDRKLIATNKNKKNNKKEKNEEKETPPYPPKEGGAPGEFLFSDRQRDNPDFQAAWREWVAYRLTAKKRPRTPAAMFNRQLRWLDRHSPAEQIEIMAQSLRNDWQGLFEIRVVAGTANRPATVHELVVIRDEIRRKIDDFRTPETQKAGLHRQVREIGERIAARANTT
ncbi:MAG: hypothetical protein QME74_01515 [Candidatus Edwardsbacteria bacterium]|nr:hypothetical protein [Candidatus Edwardsbacteria bacterium]